MKKLYYNTLFILSLIFLVFLFSTIYSIIKNNTSIWLYILTTLIGIGIIVMIVIEIKKNKPN